MAAATIGKLTFGAAAFEVVISDLLQEPVECIVNAANSELVHGGGWRPPSGQPPGANSTRNAGNESAPTAASPWEKPS